MAAAYWLLHIWQTLETLPNAQSLLITSAFWIHTSVVWAYLKLTLSVHFTNALFFAHITSVLFQHKMHLVCCLNMMMIADCECQDFAEILFSIVSSSKFPIGQLGLKQLLPPGSTNSSTQSTYQPVSIVCSSQIQHPHFIFILVQGIFHYQPPVTHYTPRIPNRGWVSWNLSIPCLSLLSSPCRSVGLPNWNLSVSC